MIIDNAGQISRKSDETGIVWGGGGGGEGEGVEYNTF